MNKILKELPDLLMLKHTNVIDFVDYKLSDRELIALEKFCYDASILLPLPRMYNDIKYNSCKNYDKNGAFKDLIVIIQYIVQLEEDNEQLRQDLEELDNVY